MSDISQSENQIQSVTSFEELVSAPFEGQVNALVNLLNGNFLSQH